MFATATVPPTAIVAAAIPATIFCQRFQTIFVPLLTKDDKDNFAPVAAETPVATTTVVTEQTEAKVVESAPIAVRQERVAVVTGDGLKDFSVVCGSFGVKANADALKEQLAAEGYKTLVVENIEAPAGAARYRVIVGTFDDRASAAAARDAFKAKYPNRSDFQGAWLLYRIK